MFGVKKHGIRFSTTEIIAFSFLAAILAGACLLSLPISSSSGEPTNFIDSLFTATSSTCVTGLVVVPTFEHWSIFGKIVVLLLIQCGGLGIVTLTSLAMIIIGKKLGIKDRMLLQDAFNLDVLSGQVRFVKRVFVGTMTFEAIGALLYMIVFIPEFGLIKGIGISVFNSVSAFCNAGIDIIGPSSLMPYVDNPLVNLVTMGLIIFGGLGFVVWWDIGRLFKMVRKGQIKVRQTPHKLTLHSKIVLISTFILIFGGALLIFLFEHDNPKTMGNLNIGGKILASLFQSVTTRTAGFMTISQTGLTDSSCLISILLMFIGGSPVGTAGGIKTTTAAVIIIAALAVVNKRRDTIAFNRRIPFESIQKALTVTLISLTMLFISTLLVATFSGGSLLDVFYETTSALGTVGLSRDYTPLLSTVGKIVITITMYLGRIGPITMAIIFGIKNDKTKSIQFPEENIRIG